MKKIIFLLVLSIIGCSVSYGQKSHACIQIDRDSKDSALYIYLVSVGATPKEKYKTKTTEAIKKACEQCTSAKIAILNDSEVVLPVFSDRMIKYILFQQTKEYSWKAIAIVDANNVIVKRL